MTTPNQPYKIKANSKWYDVSLIGTQRGTVRGEVMSPSNKPGVISKAFRIINCFIDIKSQWGVRELAQHLDLPVGTLHRLISQLEAEGILQLNSAINKYEVGLELIRISSAISSSVDIKKIARPFMERLVEKHKETICLILYHKSKQKISFIDKVNGPDPLQYHINIGELQPVPYGCSGKSILAFLSQEEFESIVKQEKFSDEQINKLKVELQMVRKKGIAYSENERIKGSKGIGAPLLNSDGYPIGSITYSIPISRVTDQTSEKEIALDIKSAAFQISKLLGYDSKNNNSI